MIMAVRFDEMRALIPSARWLIITSQRCGGRRAHCSDLLNAVSHRSGVDAHGDGRALHFYLAGINNQNFLMRDKETGTWWQQITGKAIYGPLKGTALNLVLSDEFTLGEWRSEFPGGKVLAPVPTYVKEYDDNWEPEIDKLPVVINFPGTELKSRDVVIGVTVDGVDRAYPWKTLRSSRPSWIALTARLCFWFSARTENRFGFLSAVLMAAMRNSF